MDLEKTLIDTIVSETNIYVSQNGSSFLGNQCKTKAFVGGNYLMGIN